MKPAPRKWAISDARPLEGFAPVVGQVLANRGHTSESAALFLDDETLLSPWGLLGMRDAVDAITETVKEGKPVAIYGDYDTDGVSACALLTRALQAGGIAVRRYIPNRQRDGYGVHLHALQELHADGVGCVVTVDCGTTSIEAAAGRPEGLRLVITDHHLPAARDGKVEMASADALVNPKQPGCTYGFDGLAGAGVAFKLVQALEEQGVLPSGTSDMAVGLAALGTVADMMPLLGENRAIVKRGLKSMSQVCGIAALCEVASAQLPPRASDVAFGLAPRINAAGRMDDAILALELCLTDNAEEAKRLATELDATNKQRQAAVAQALREAEAKVADLPEETSAIVVGDPAWPPGIVGLVAGRIAERYARPTFAVALEPDQARGSGRSASGVHLVEALETVASTMLRFGGHAAAAGFTIETSRFEEFVTAVNGAVAAQLDGNSPERTFNIDGVVTCGDLRPALAQELQLLEPCGQANPGPVLMLTGVKVLSAATFGTDNVHLRLTLSDDKGIAEGIAFFKGHAAGHLPRGRLIDVCGSVDRDYWQGQERIRLHLRDIRPAQTSAAAGSTELEKVAELRGRDARPAPISTNTG
jgi:single-stranded-DNA-specific exonuclease